MTSFAVAQDRDANRVVIATDRAIKLSSEWTFDAATTGAVGAHTLFSVTGQSLVTVFGVCSTDVTGSGTGEVGVAGNTAALIAQTTGTAIDATEVWTDATPAVGVKALPSAFIAHGLDIILTIATNTFTAGVITFFCLYRPLSSDASITVATPA